VLKYLVVCIGVLALVASKAESRTFNPKTDVFSFSNELYFDYKPTQAGDVQFSHRARGETPDYSRHCFILARSVLQYYKFADFRPDLAKVSDADYFKIVKKLSRIPAWSSGNAKKIEVPGYANLYDFSAAHTLLMQKELGIWWASFWRLGNWRIVYPVPRSGQKKLSEWLKSELDASRIHAIYITRFKPMNHCVVAYRYAGQPNGDLIFSVYDPNQPGKIVHLTYQASSRSFFFDKTWYYKGGLVTALKLYVSPIM
jgi:hypothetical protein